MQHTILVAGVVFIVLLVMILKRVPVELGRSLSVHIAKSEDTIRLTQYMLPVVNMLVLIWLWGWAYSALETGIVFSLTLTLACIFGVMVAIIPYKGSWEQKRMHDAFAWLYSVPLLMSGLMLFSKAQGIQVILIIGAILAQAGIFFLFFSYRPSRKYFFPMQTTYLLLFGMILLVMTYV